MCKFCTYDIDYRKVVAFFATTCMASAHIEFILTNINPAALNKPLFCAVL